MANFTEKQIQGMLDDLRDEFGWDILYAKTKVEICLEKYDSEA